MVLAELIQKAEYTGKRFSTAWIPLKLDGKDVEIDFEPYGSNQDGWVINLRITKK